MFTTKESSYEDHTKSVHTNEIRRKRETTQSVSQYTIELTSGHRRATGGLTDHRTASVIYRFTRALEVRAQIFAGFDARNSPGSVRRAVSALIDCTGSRRHPSNGWRAIP